MNQGDKIEVQTKEKIFSGVFINEKNNTIIVKLDNGYNVGIDRKNIVALKKTGEGSKIEIKYTQKAENKMNLPKIAILHTGGTIASKVDYRTGAVFTSFKPDDLLGLFPELGEIAQFESELISNMWSDDLRFKHFTLIAEAAKKYIMKGVHGIIIGMGTDNLAVAAAALSFAFEKVPVPIILVGSQRSSDRGSSDAAMNVICAAEFIVKTDFAGVAICMHDYTDDKACVILPATKTRKLHSSRRDAFKPVNDSCIARVDYFSRKIEFIQKNYQKRDEGKELVLKPQFEERVGLLKIHVNMFPEQFELYKGWKGLVIEGTGLGHTPLQVPNEYCKIHEKIKEAIKKVVESGCVVVMTTQCIYGRVHLHVYSKGTDLAELGVISGEDMLAETALVKLSWLLANFPITEAKRLISHNLRGEINPRIEATDFDGIYT
jgi:glutamyl-tRNA(Gln) amidotransferase subunit D